MRLRCSNVRTVTFAPGILPLYPDRPYIRRCLSSSRKGQEAQMPSATYDLVALIIGSFLCRKTLRVVNRLPLEKVVLVVLTEC